MVKMQCRKMPNWKTPARILVEKPYIIASTHSSAAKSYPWWRKTLTRLDDLWKNTTLPKDPAKRSAVDNNRTISFLPLMRKLMTGILAEKMYSYLERENILPPQQKGCRRGSRGTKNQLVIDKTVLSDCKKRHTNLAIAWIDYKEANDMLPHSWINECLEMFGIANNVKDFLNNSMKSWKFEFNASGRKLGEVDIRREIFQDLHYCLFCVRFHWDGCWDKLRFVMNRATKDSDSITCCLWMTWNCLPQVRNK